MALSWSSPSAGRDPAAKLELVPQTGHTSAITSVSLSSDGKLALTGSNDCTAILWDTQTGKKLRVFKGHNDWVRLVRLSGNGKRALTHSLNGTTRLWDAHTGKLLHVLKGHKATFVISLTLSGDGKRALAGFNNKTAILWDTRTGKKLRVFKGHTSGVSSVSLSRDGSRALTGSWDRTAILWDARTGKRLRIFKRHKHLIHSVSLSGNGKRALTSSSETATEGNTVILWDAETGQQLQSFEGHNSGILSADGSRALTASAWDRTATLWDAQTGKQLHALKEPPSRARPMSLSGDGTRVLTCCGEHSVANADSKTASLWDAQTGKQLLTLKGHDSSVNSVSLSGDGARALTGSKDATAILWDARMGKPLQVFKGHSYSVQSVSLSGDGTRALICSYGWGWENTVRLWDAQTGKEYQVRKGDTYGVLSADGKRALTATSQKATLWDTQTGKELRVFGESIIGRYAISLSSDGQRALTGFCNTLTLWDVQTGKQLFVRERGERNLSGSIEAVSLSADGTRALSGSWDKTAVVWDTLTGKQPLILKGHTQRIISVSLSSDGKYALTGSNDRTAILWDAQTGKQLRVFKGHTFVVTSVSLSGDGKHALTGSADGTARLWDVQTGKELCRLITVEGGKEWLVVTPSGLFDGSLNAPRFLAYRIRGTLEFVPLDRFQHKFYQPGLLSLLMAGKRPTPGTTITRSLPPKVRITSPARPGLEIEQGKLQVKAVAQTRGDYPVKTFRLLLDGRPYRGQLGVRKVANARLGESSASWTVELEPGRHTLKVLAETEYVQGTSEEVKVRYTGGGSAPVELPSLYVLAVGISNYPGTRKLDYAARDAEAVARAFQHNSKSLFKKVRVKVVTDRAAGRKGFFSGLQWLRQNMSQKSVGVLFFAGHGEKDKDGSLYLLPADFEEKDLAGSAIDADVLKKQLAGIPGRLTLILDACHSGAIDKGKKRGVGELTDQLVRDLTADESGLVVMCSALGSEQAQESHEFRHGLFTQALVEGLSGKASKTREGAVYLTALDAYVAARVKELSKGQQNPVTGKPTSVRDFPLSRP